MRVLSVFGTRPEAIKMAPVVRVLSRTPQVESFVCVTGQHREMLDQVLDLFEIVPDVDLDLMQPDQTLAELTAAILTQLDPVVRDLQPDWILAQGDTTTVMATALVAHYRRTRMGHVEAGLRTGDKWQPFPEEENRRVASVLADLHFAPTEWARGNLLREGIPGERIHVTGNTVIDALHAVVRKPQPNHLRSLLAEMGLGGGCRGTPPRLILVTAHRRENHGAPLEGICAALRELAERYGESIRIVYPVHLNPNVREPVYRLLDGLPNVRLVPPVDYLTMAHLIKQSTLVLTDSGGLQEEVPVFGVPVLVLRRATERPEGVQAGTARLVGTDRGQIVAEARRLLEDAQSYEAMARAVNPYGDGRAAERIVGALSGSECSPGGWRNLRRSGFVLETLYETAW